MGFMTASYHDASRGLDVQGFGFGYGFLRVRLRPSQFRCICFQFCVCVRTEFAWLTASLNPIP